MIVMFLHNADVPFLFPQFHKANISHFNVTASVVLKLDTSAKPKPIWILIMRLWTQTWIYRITSNVWCQWTVRFVYL